MSESTPTGATALLIISPLVVLAFVIFGAIKCASKGFWTWSQFRDWAIVKHHDISSSDQVKSKEEIALETGEPKSGRSCTKITTYTDTEILIAYSDTFLSKSSETVRRLKSRQASN